MTDYATITNIVNNIINYRYNKCLRGIPGIPIIEVYLVCYQIIEIIQIMMVANTVIPSLV